MKLSMTTDYGEPVKPCKQVSASKGGASEMSPAMIGVIAAGLVFASFLLPFPGYEESEVAWDSFWDVALIVAFAVGAGAAKYFRDAKLAGSEKAPKKVVDDAGTPVPKQEK